MSTRVADSFVNEETALFLRRDSWQDWTPTVTQNVAVSITINYAKFVIIANTVIIKAHLAITSAGTAGNAITIGGVPTAIVPFYAGGSVDTVGSMSINDASVQPYYGWAYFFTTSSFQARQHNVGGNLGVIPNFALANGDSIGVQAMYERA